MKEIPASIAVSDELQEAFEKLLKGEVVHLSISRETAEVIKSSLDGDEDIEDVDLFGDYAREPIATLRMYIEEDENRCPGCGDVIEDGEVCEYCSRMATRQK